MTENTLIKAFITKCIATVKYRYYANQERKGGFESDSREIEEIANNEMYHAFALLDRLGFADNTDFLEDMEREEKRQIECKIEQEDLCFICDIDKNHLQRLLRIKEERKNESAYKIKKCTLCGFVDKSGKKLNNCPLCYNKTFNIN